MAEDTTVEEMPGKPPAGHRYRDEMNFAEFPLAAVSDVVPEGLKTLEFTDEITDPSTGKPVTRTLTVTAADKFGLPTALDDELLLGLVQLSSEKGFVDRKVHFSRYELIKLLGWRDESKSYKRVEDALNRWTGVTLQYRKGWWAKDERCWVSETFHVLDQVTVFDRERIERRRKMVNASPEKAMSSFVWNETVFQSFRSGYVKALDFDFYKSLDSAVAKRMYRFLDKRFYHKGRWEFDLRTFACEHVGLVKGYSNSELKRKLAPAVAELESRGYLAPLADAERFVRVRTAEWRAVFVKAAKRVVAPPTLDGDGTLVADLVARGISRHSAKRLLAEYSQDRVREKIRHQDWLKTQPGQGGIRNRAGWLYAAITHDFAPPPEVIPAARPTPPNTPASGPLFAPVPPAPAPSADEQAFSTYWAALSADEQADFEREAVEGAPAFLRRQYHVTAEERGTLWRVTRDRILLDQYKKRRPLTQELNLSDGL